MAKVDNRLNRTTNLLCKAPKLLSFSKLTLKAPNKNCSRRHFKFLLYLYGQQKYPVRNVSGNIGYIKIGVFSEKKRVSEHLRCPNI